MIDERYMAAMVKEIRQQDNVGAHDVAIINMIGAVYDSVSELEEERDSVDLTHAEAAEVLNELPTNYDAEN